MVLLRLRSYRSLRRGAEDRDYLVVTHLAAGVLILNATDLRRSQARRLGTRAGATWQWEHDAARAWSRSKSSSRPEHAFAYDTASDSRDRGNLQTVVVTPDGRGANGSAATLTTSIHAPRAEQPARANHRPRDTVTWIERSPSGRLTRITRALGGRAHNVTQVAYNAYGQPTRVTNPDGHATDYLYATASPSDGYLEREIVDPAGLALVTRYETDALGRVTARIDPRGVRHEAVYNELGWTVEQTAAATPAQDGSGAPALGYRTVYRHDEIGNLAPARSPSRSSSGPFSMPTARSSG